MGSTLVITNDFPPRQGGIETFVHAMATRLPGDVIVYTSREEGDAAFDAGLPFPVIRALPQVRRAVPEATLLIVGAGGRETKLRRIAGEGVVFAGGRPHHELPPFYAAADVFAMPCRTRLLGLEAEGLGIVFLEAAAAGLPVLAGDSGGAPEAVRDGETGHVVNGRSVPAIADRLIELLTAPGTMGEKGRAWAEAEWSWDRSAERLTELLSEGR